MGCRYTSEGFPAKEVWGVMPPRGLGRLMAPCLQAKSLIPQAMIAKSHPKFAGPGLGWAHLSANLRLERSSNLRSQSVSTNQEFFHSFLVSSGAGYDLLTRSQFCNQSRLSLLSKLPPLTFVDKKHIYFVQQANLNFPENFWKVKYQTY